MRKSKAFLRFFIALFFLSLFSNCDNMLGGFINPADPESEDYEGVYTSDVCEIVEIPSYNVFCPPIQSAKVIGATGYDVQIAGDEEFSSILFEKDNTPDYILDTDYKALSEGIYWCRARAHSSDGAGEWCEGVPFEIVAPEIPADLDNAAFTGSPELYWADVEGAVSYELSYSAQSDFSSESIDSLDDNSFSTALGSGNWYWRYRAQNSLGEYSDWSNSITFYNTNEIPSALEEMTATVGQSKVFLNWESADIEDLAGYEVTVSPDIDGFDEPCILDMNENSLFIEGLDSNTSYTFNIQVIDSVDQRSSASSKIINTSDANDPIYLVTYEANDATGGEIPDRQIKFSDENVTLAGNEAVLYRDGYTYSGWNTASDGSGTDYSESEEYSLNQDLELYAKWEPNTYMLSFDPNDGSGTMADQAFSYDILASLNVNTFIRSDYTFIGWSSTSDGEVEYVDGADITIGISDTTLYAIWTESEHSITFDANGGSGIMDDQKVSYGMTAPLNSNDYSKTGYDFIGWSTEPDGSVEYTDGADFTMGIVDAILFAVWNASEYSITFDANGGSGTMDNQVVSYGTTTSISTNEFTKAGYTFIGWSTESEGSVEYSDGVEITVGEGNLAIYAVWEINEYTISFNANGSSGTMDDQVVSYGTIISLSASTFTKTGYEFIGWSTDPDGSVEYSDGEEITVGEEDLALYAIWEINEYTISFNINGGSGTMEDQLISYGTTSSLNTNEYTRVGYEFMGWSTESEGSVEYGDGAEITVSDEDIVLYAIWEMLYSLTFSANGGSGSMDEINLISGSTISLSANTFTRTGYLFQGWSTSSSGSVIYANSAEFTMNNSDVVLYAIWEKTYTVSFNANGGSGSVSNFILTSGSSFSIPMTHNTSFSRTGYLLFNWSTNPDGSGDLYYPGGAYTIGSSNLTLYAVWVKTYYVSFNANGGSGSMTDQLIPSGWDGMLKNNSFYRTGYSFKGWATSSSGSVVYTDGDWFTMGSSDVTLYAVW